MARRQSGRTARHAQHTASLDNEPEAVRPGLHAGCFKPLTDAQVLRLHEAALQVLAEIGMGQAIPSCVDLVTRAGGSYTDQGRLLFPRSMVEDAVAMAAKDIVLYGQNPRHDMDLSEGRTHFGTAGAAVEIMDPHENSFRESTLNDLYNVARLVDKLEHIHFFQRPMVARDLVDSYELDVNTIYACVSGTTKHIGSSWTSVENYQRSVAMLHAVAGSEKKWRERPFVSMSCCFVVPPLRFAEDACHTLEAAVHAGMPMLLLSAGQAGATSPAALAGSVVQSVAEVLAALVYVNLLKPGHPVIFGTWPFVSDLRTGAMTGGSGEQAILAAACGQMGRFYGLPTGIAAGMSDAKMPDAQSGYEKGYSDVLAGHSGANLIYESAGMQASLLGCCYESYVIDNDMLGAINRTVRGVDVTEESLSLEAMREVCLNGPAHYLGHGQTVSLMRSEYVYPRVGDRTSPKEWKERGSHRLLDNAKARVDEILGSHYPSHVSPEVDEQIRREYPICLLRERMAAAA